MKGIIEGKFAEKYYNTQFSKKVIYKPNNFLKREILEEPKYKNKKLVIADLGCGTGVTIEYLKEKCKIIYGIDGSDEMIKLCKNNFFDDKNVELKKSNLLNIPLKNEECDVTILRMVLHHIPNKNKYKVLSEALRITKPKGKILIMDKFLFYPLLINNLFDFTKNLKERNQLFSHSYIKFEKIERFLEKFTKINFFHKIKREFYYKINVSYSKL
jgi:ubiquinone/menaquinone biosynthesis C-methylase UbiE